MIRAVLLCSILVPTLQASYVPQRVFSPVRASLTQLRGADTNVFHTTAPVFAEVSMCERPVAALS